MDEFKIKRKKHGNFNPLKAIFTPTYLMGMITSTDTMACALKASFSSLKNLIYGILNADSDGVFKKRIC